MSQNHPYVEKAQAFIAESEGDQFVIAYIKFKLFVSTGKTQPKESPTFIHDRFIQAKPIRLAGFDEPTDTRRILYHAESPDQANRILSAYLEGKGYSIWGFPVIFETASQPLPGDLEKIATHTIAEYRAIPKDRVTEILNS